MFKILLFLSPIISCLISALYLTFLLNLFEDLFHFNKACKQVGLSQPVFKPQFSDETSYQQNNDSEGVTNYKSSLNSDTDYSLPANVNTEDDSLGTNDNMSTAIDNLIKKFNEVLLGLQIQLYKVVDGIKSNIINVHFLLSPEKLSDDIEKNINNDDDDSNDVKEILNNNENIPDKNKILDENEEQGKKEDTNQENKEETKQEKEEEINQEKEEETNQEKEETKQDGKEEKQLENGEANEEETPLEKALKMFYEFMKYHAESEDEQKEESIIEDVKSTNINPELSLYEKSTSYERQSTNDIGETQSLNEADLWDINDNRSSNEKTDHINEVEDGIFEDIGFSITKLWNELFG
ncbi:uncharacterized protein LOC142329072 isoform X1 [Lycorma delicatula]|uniref:uncharacterized protein LOC142329072 isoform X1 n=1 Tax=Lycorma delicatula TaxID=130591 RepID=UPI003F512E89